jgi:hypothetical protein
MTSRLFVAARVLSFTLLWHNTALPLRRRRRRLIFLLPRPLHCPGPAFDRFVDSYPQHSLVSRTDQACSGPSDKLTSCIEANGVMLPPPLLCRVALSFRNRRSKPVQHYPASHLPFPYRAWLVYVLLSQGDASKCQAELKEVDLCVGSVLCPDEGRQLGECLRNGTRCTGNSNQH